eukprot:9705689-Karenia_brevis.AAC.1
MLANEPWRLLVPMLPNVSGTAATDVVRHGTLTNVARHGLRHGDDWDIVRHDHFRAKDALTQQCPCRYRYLYVIQRG